MAEGAIWNLWETFWARCRGTLAFVFLFLAIFVKLLKINDTRMNTEVVDISLSFIKCSLGGRYCCFPCGGCYRIHRSYIKSISLSIFSMCHICSLSCLNYVVIFMSKIVGIWSRSICWWIPDPQIGSKRLRRAFYLPCIFIRLILSQSFARLRIIN